MRITAAGQSAGFSFDTTGRTTANMGWVQRSWQFTANSTSTVLEMCDLATTGSCGAAVDNMFLTVDCSTETAHTSWGHVKSFYRQRGPGAAGRSAGRRPAPSHPFACSALKRPSASAPSASPRSRSATSK